MFPRLNGPDPIFWALTGRGDAGYQPEVARGLTLADTEGSATLCAYMKTMLRSFASYIWTKNKYLLVVPWLFAQADDPDTCQQIVQQIEDKRPEDHDALTRKWAETLLGDIKARRDGRPVSERLQHIIDILRNVPLDESKGEGYHADTGHELGRAPGATQEHLKASIRLTGNCDKIIDFCAAHGHDGRKVIDYEWYCFKRVLQPPGGRRWRPVRMPVSVFSVCFPIRLV